MAQIHVAQHGTDANPGTLKAPLRTIQRAADLAQPGDVITVHEGIYRERLDPPRGGTSEAQRIVYQAAPGERVEIRGSEEIKTWEREQGDVWKVVLPDAFFGETNPFREEIRGDWFRPGDRLHHTGDVYLNGRSFLEAVSLAEVRTTKQMWSAEAGQAETVLWANLGGFDPNREQVEINVRPTCFFPRKTGINYITVRGFRMCHAATQWAPPTAEQIGLIGPHWSKGWIIENNIIHDSRCSGISLGKERATGQNEWSELKVKHGTQREREVVFRALHEAGWSKENIGSHIVRHNTIYHCEQTGICGHLGAIFSEITGNHIYDIHTKNQFNGAEIAGIKFHAPIDVTIRGNYVHHACRGIWMDWQAQGTRITGNLLHDNSYEDLFVEVSHGPYVVDNNILLSPFGVRNWSQGGAFVHNLIAGKVDLYRVLIRYTPYHYPHSTAVAGLMTIQGGDDRWLNNVFLGHVAETKGGTIDLGDGKADAAPMKTGLSVYDEYPIAGDNWCVGTNVDDYANHRFPVDIAGNVYGSAARPFAREVNPTVLVGCDPQVALVTNDEEVFLHLTGFESNPVPLITADRLGKAFEPEVPFQNPDGSPLRIDTDYVGVKRKPFSCAGPFANLPAERFALKVW